DPAPTWHPAYEDMLQMGCDVRAELSDALHADALLKPMLWVVDNVPEPLAGTSPRPLATWAPALGKVTCIATSRRQVDDFGQIETTELDVLGKPAAVALLTTGVSGADALQPAQWGDIAEWVGRLPLALTLLAAALRKRAVLPTDLWKLTQTTSTTTV